MCTLSDRAVAAIVNVHIRSNLTALAKSSLNGEMTAPAAGDMRYNDHLARAVVPRPDFEAVARKCGWEIADSGLQFINPKIIELATGRVRSWGHLSHGIATALDWEMLCKSECSDAARILRSSPDTAMEAYTVSEALAVALDWFGELVIDDIPGIIIWSRIARTPALVDDPILKQIGHLALSGRHAICSKLVDVDAIRHVEDAVAALHKRFELTFGIIGDLRRALPILERLEKDVARWDIATKATGIATLNALRHIIGQAEATVASGNDINNALLAKAYAEAHRLRPIITDILGRNLELWDIARSTQETQDLSALLAKLHKVTAPQAATIGR